MFSNSAKYAIKAVLYLAVKSSEENKIIINDIAKPINVPKHYIGKILQDLSRKHIVSSSKGPKGGFYLNSFNRQTTVFDIIEAVDGEERISSCLLSLNQCNKDNPCALHSEIYEKKLDITMSLKNLSIDFLAKQIEQGKSVLPL